MPLLPSTLLFYVLLRDPSILETLLRHLPLPTLGTLRLSNSFLSTLLAAPLFKRTLITFTPATFTKPARIQALARIGKYIEHLTFAFPHSPATFLPPLIHPRTGQEIPFIYSPHTSTASAPPRRQNAPADLLAEILLHQYPPLFHAATNVPSFIHAFTFFLNLRHLTISCPGQVPSERYRRDIVDYALISLRIAIEKAPLAKFHKLSLAPVHPGAFTYLRHMPGIGGGPAASRRWSQVNNLRVTVESWDFGGPAAGGDHLRMMSDFIASLASRLEKFSFGWCGEFQGPCPLELEEGDVGVLRAVNGYKLFNEVTTSMTPLPPLPASQTNSLSSSSKHKDRKSSAAMIIKMRHLRYMELRNLRVTSRQIRHIIAAHKATVRDFDLRNVTLTTGDSWSEALEPLQRHHRRCQPHHKSSGSYWEEEMQQVRGGKTKRKMLDEEVLFGEGLPLKEERVLEGVSAAVRMAGRNLIDGGGGRNGAVWKDVMEEGPERATGDAEPVAWDTQSVTTRLTKKQKPPSSHPHSYSHSHHPSYESATSSSSSRKGPLRSHRSHDKPSRRSTEPTHYRSPGNLPTPAPSPTPSSKSHKSYKRTNTPTRLAALGEVLLPFPLRLPQRLSSDSASPSSLTKIKTSPVVSPATEYTISPTVYSPFSRPAFPAPLATPPVTPPPSSSFSPASSQPSSSPPSRTPPFTCTPVLRNPTQDSSQHLLATNPTLRAQRLCQAREQVLHRMAQEFAHNDDDNRPQAQEPPSIVGAISVVTVDGGCASSFAGARAFREGLFSRVGVGVEVEVVEDFGVMERTSALVPLILSR